MATHFKKGFSDGSHQETLYEYNIIQNNPSPENPVSYTVSIPGKYIGRDQMGDPTYPEQVQWLNSLKRKYNLTIREVWYGTWEITGGDSYKKFLELITP